MSVSLEAGFASIFGVDDVHGLALPGCREKLATCPFLLAVQELVRLTELARSEPDETEAMEPDAGHRKDRCRAHSTVGCSEPAVGCCSYVAYSVNPMFSMCRLSVGVMPEPVTLVFIR